MRIKLFDTADEAKAEADSMVGWTTHIATFGVWIGDNPDAPTTQYAIRCNGTLYLCNDGFVRGAGYEVGEITGNPYSET